MTYQRNAYGYPTIEEDFIDDDVFFGTHGHYGATGTNYRAANNFHTTSANTLKGGDLGELNIDDNGFFRLVDVTLLSKREFIKSGNTDETLLRVIPSRNNKLYLLYLPQEDYEALSMILPDLTNEMLDMEEAGVRIRRVENLRTGLPCFIDIRTKDGWTEVSSIDINNVKDADHYLVSLLTVIPSESDKEWLTQFDTKKIKVGYGYYNRSYPTYGYNNPKPTTSILPPTGSSQQTDGSLTNDNPLSVTIDVDEEIEKILSGEEVYYPDSYEDTKVSVRIATAIIKAFPKDYPRGGRRYKEMLSKFGFSAIEVDAMLPEVYEEYISYCEEFGYKG